MNSELTSRAPENFTVARRDGEFVISRQRFGPPWFMRAHPWFFGLWLFGWAGTGVFLTYQAFSMRSVPWWLVCAWWVCGAIVSCFVFGRALWRICSTTSYTFSENDLVIENVFLARRSQQR